MKSCSVRSPIGGPQHVAIIMDGNGRWATARGLPRVCGHLMGAEAVLRVSDAAADLGIPFLSLFAFSADNWKRPASEVAGIMALIDRYLRLQASRALARGTRICVIGRRDRIPEPLRRTIHEVESLTRGARERRLRIAVDYSARASILNALRGLAQSGSSDETRFRRALSPDNSDREVVPDVDLLIRTGGERRLSDFLLWESAYAELLFLNKLWPEFSAADLSRGLQQFRRRRRRFGSLEPARCDDPVQLQIVERAGAMPRDSLKLGTSTAADTPRMTDF